MKQMKMLLLQGIDYDNEFFVIKPTSTMALITY